MMTDYNTHDIQVSFVLLALSRALFCYNRYYGFDPHDDSDNLRIHNNLVYNNGERWCLRPT